MGERVGRLRSLWSEVGGLSIHARVATGPVPPGRPEVVLVHGMSVSSRYFVPTARRLAPDYHVYAPDLPGFGLSDDPRCVLDVPELADALAGWMDSIGLERAAMLGNSFGCQVIVDLAVRRPERVERIVMQGPAFPPGERTLPHQIVRWMQNSPREPASLGLVMVRDYLDCGMWRGLGTLRVALNDRMEGKLPGVHAPVLVVRGAHDPLCPQWWAEEIVRRLPDGRLRVIPGGSHTLVYAAPLELVRVVRPFLDEARATSARPHAEAGGRSR